jgi:Zn-dependent metalloprotease
MTRTHLWAILYAPYSTGVLTTAKVSLLVLFCLLASLLPAQDGGGSTHLDCSNFNAFLEGDSVETLRHYAEEIYPSGLIRFNPAKTQYMNSFEDFAPYLEVCDGCTFQLDKAWASRFDEDKTYARYQQYYQGVEVENAGYIIADGGGSNPCGISSLTPFIASAIHLTDMEPGFEAADMLNQAGSLLAEQQLPVNISDYGLVIARGLVEDCDYTLTWKVRYQHQGSHVAWIDAHTGALLKRRAVDAHLIAPTQVYGDQDMDDTQSGGVTQLVTMESETEVLTYDFGPVLFDLPTNIDDFNIGLVPTTTANNEWPCIDCDAFMPSGVDGVYQAHHATTKAAEVFRSPAMDFPFNRIHVGANFIPTNARAYVGASSMQGDSYVAFGSAANRSHSMAVFDVVGHELGHILLYDFFGRTGSTDGSRAIDEGLCDIIGTFVESKIPVSEYGGLDWQMGDDVVTVEGLEVVRDFQNIQYGCVEDVIGLDPNEFLYERSLPLSHWFYLITEGVAYGSGGLGIDLAMDIVLETLLSTDPAGFYESFRDASIALVEEEYGRCSEEARVVKRAWFELCFYEEFYCEGDIVGPTWVCEEDDMDLLQLHIHEPESNATYWWYYPLEWTVSGGNPNSGLYVGTSFTVTDFPDYPYYPQFFEIHVYSPQVGLSSKRSITIELLDCDNDDPTCEEYHALVEGTIPSVSVASAERQAAQLQVFDLTGRVLYSGSVLNQEQLYERYQGQLLFEAYYDDQGDLLYAKKQFFVE